MMEETNIQPIQPDFEQIQDREYLSDFDKEIRNWKELGLFDGDDEK